ncbi:MAG: hypothetical protein ACRDU5_20785 [Mycobacterium sp.]
MEGYDIIGDVHALLDDVGSAAIDLRRAGVVGDPSVEARRVDGVGRVGRVDRDDAAVPRRIPARCFSR